MDSEKIKQEIRLTEKRLYELKREADIDKLETDSKDVRDDYLYELGKLKGLKTALYS